VFSSVHWTHVRKDYDVFPDAANNRTYEEIKRLLVDSRELFKGARRTKHTGHWVSRMSCS